MKPPAFQFYADDFVSGVMDMTRQDRGDYIMLLCWQWSKGFIPSEKAKLARIVGGDVSEDVLAKFQWNETGGRNVRMEKVRAEQDAYRAKQSHNANIRWAKHVKHPQKECHGNATAYAVGVPTHMPNGCQTDAMAMPADMPNACSPSPSLTTKEEVGAGKPPRKPTERSPANGLEEVKAFFAENGGSQAKAFDFFDHYECNGWMQGKSPMKQWKAAARRWCRGEQLKVCVDAKGREFIDSNGINPKARAGMEAELREHEQQIWTTDPGQKPKVQARIDELRKALGHAEPQAALL